MTEPQILQSRLEFADSAPADSRLAVWASMVRELTDVIPDPGRVELILTDQYDRLAGHYHVQALHRSNPDMTAADYQAQRVDGARAAAITVELPGNREVIVASHRLLAMPRGALRHTLLHEGQHVRMIQHDDSAYAAHRRIDRFALPDDLTWEFLWMAESSIDEFRAERTIHENGWTFPGNLVTPAEFRLIGDAFGRAAVSFRRSGDTMAAYHQSMAALDRYAMFLAYAAAGVAAGTLDARQWQQVPELTPLVELLRASPGTGVVVPMQDLLETAVAQARLLRAGYKKMGFDYRRLPDDQGTWLDVF